MVGTQVSGMAKLIDIRFNYEISKCAMRKRKVEQPTPDLN